MADTKISALTDGAPAVGSTDQVPIARSGANRRLLVSDILTSATTHSGTTIRAVGGTNNIISLGNGNTAPAALEMVLQNVSEQLQIKNQYGAFTVGIGGSTNVTLGSNNSLTLQRSNANILSFPAGAGSGALITAGTLTTDLPALSVTRTNNNAAVATGVQFAFTDTTSAAGFLPFQVLGGAAATTNLFSLGKAGETTILSLAGSGSRAVLADANGLLSAPVSDELMKEEWLPLPESYGLPMVMRLTPRKGKYKDRSRYGEQDYLGFYARETSEFLPEITGQDNNGTFYLSDEKVTAVLVKAVQQLARHVGL